MRIVFISTSNVSILHRKDRRKLILEPNKNSKIIIRENLIKVIVLKRKGVATGHNKKCSSH